MTTWTAYCVLPPSLSYLQALQVDVLLQVRLLGPDVEHGALQLYLLRCTARYETKLEAVRPRRYGVVQAGV
jgi:hypothetical protein